MASFQSQTRALTLAEALAAPRLLNRDTVVATEPMPNLRDTPGGPRGVALDDKPVSQVSLGRLVRVIWLVPAMDRLFSDTPEARRR